MHTTKGNKRLKKSIKITLTHSRKGYQEAKSKQLPYEAYGHGICTHQPIFRFVSREMGQFRSTQARIGKEKNLSAILLFFFNLPVK